MYSVMSEWEQITQLKHQLLNQCAWGNFRTHLRKRKLMTEESLTKDEREKYGLLLVNKAINHELYMYDLVTKHFGDMADCLMTKQHSGSVAEEFAKQLWKPDYLRRVLPRGYSMIRYGDRGLIDSDSSFQMPIVILKIGQPHHMMGVLCIENTLYFIDSNADPPDQILIDNVFSGKTMVRYPTDPLNRELYGKGHCTAWTVFFIHVLQTVGPIDYRQIPKYVLLTLFTNYCAYLREQI